MAYDAYDRSRGLVARLGHFAPEMLVIAIGAVIVLGFHPIAGPMALTVSVGLVAVVLASWVLMRRHDRGLCKDCMASMPLNPAEQAARYRRRFWMSHTGGERRFVVPYLIVLVASNFATGPVGRTFWAAMQLSMIYLILAYSTHRRLQPWCPWCSDGGGGSHVPSAPDPLPWDHRQRV